MQLLRGSDGDGGASRAASVAPLTVTPATPLQPPVNNEGEEEAKEEEEVVEEEEEAAEKEEEHDSQDRPAALERRLTDAAVEMVCMDVEARGYGASEHISLEAVCQLCCIRPGWPFLPSRHLEYSRDTFLPSACVLPGYSTCPPPPQPVSARQYEGIEPAYDVSRASSR